MSHCILNLVPLWLLDLTLDKGMEDSYGEVILSTARGQKALSEGLAQKGGFSDGSETLGGLQRTGRAR